MRKANHIEASIWIILEDLNNYSAKKKKIYLVTQKGIKNGGMAGKIIVLPNDVAWSERPLTFTATKSPRYIITVSHYLICFVFIYTLFYIGAMTYDLYVQKSYELFERPLTFSAQVLGVKLYYLISCDLHSFS